MSTDVRIMYSKRCIIIRFISQFKKQNIMNITILLIGIGSVAAFIAPFFLFQYARKDKSLKVQKELKKVAKDNGLNITECDIWDDKFIGIDPAENMIFLLKDINNKSAYSTINLNSFKTCKLQVESRNEKHIRVVDGIYLLLKPKNANESDKKINFYNSNTDMSIHDEMDVAKKWEKNIVSAIIP